MYISILINCLDFQIKAYKSIDANSQGFINCVTQKFPGWCPNGPLFLIQDLDNCVEDEYDSIFVNKCTVKFVICVFKGNAKRNIQKPAC